MVHQGVSDMASCTEEGELFVLKSDVELYLYWIVAYSSAALFQTLTFAPYSAKNELFEQNLLPA